MLCRDGIRSVGHLALADGRPNGIVGNALSRSVSLVCLRPIVGAAVDVACLSRDEHCPRTELRHVGVVAQHAAGIATDILRKIGCGHGAGWLAALLKSAFSSGLLRARWDFTSRRSLRRLFVVDADRAAILGTRASGEHACDHDRCGSTLDLRIGVTVERTGARTVPILARNRIDPGGIQ